MELTIEGRKVQVDDSFRDLPQEEKVKTVEEIASKMGVKAGDGDTTSADVGGEMVRMGAKAAPGAVLGLPALVTDAVQQLGNYGYQGVDAVFGTDLAERHNRARGGPMGTTIGVGQLGERLANATGVPEPTSNLGKVGEAVGSGAIEALGGTGLFRVAGKIFRSLPEAEAFMREMGSAPVAQAVVGGAAAGGGEIAQQEGVNPMVGVGLGLAGGVGAAGVAGAARAGARGLERGIETVTRSTPEAVEAGARDVLRGRAADPDAAAAALATPRELVPGSRPTTLEASGDTGLAGLDREMRTANPMDYEIRRGEQNKARVAEMKSLGGEGEVTDALGAFESRLKSIDEQTARFAEEARSRAETATGDATSRVTDAETAGRNLREPMQEARDAANRETNALWKAVDPEGTLQVGTGIIKAAVGKEFGSLSPTAKLGLSAAEKEIAEQIRSYGPKLSFSEFGDLRSRLSEVLTTIQRASGQATPGFRRLAVLKEATSEAMRKGVTRGAVDDPALFQRLKELFRDAVGVRGDDAGAVGRNVQVGLREGGRLPANGGSGAQARQPRAPARDTRLPISEFIARNGGLPLDAESTARDWGNRRIKGRPLAHANGRSIDGFWRDTLVENGYLEPDTSRLPPGMDPSDPGAKQYLSSQRDVTNEVYKALEDDLAGRNVSRETSSGGLADEHSAAKATVISRLKAEGFQGKPDMAAVDRAAAMMVEGAERHPTTAYERALTQAEEPAAAPAARDVPLDLPPGERGRAAAPEVDTGAPARYAAASKATRELHQTYDKGSAGEVLRRGDTNNAAYRASDASIPGKAFKQGNEGGNRIRQMREAGATDDALAEAAALSIVQKAVVDNVVDPRKFRIWSKAHASALAALPADVRKGFQSAADASETLSRVAARRAELLKEADKSAVGKVLKVPVEDLPNKLGTIVKSTRSMGELANAVKGNTAAEQGLKRMVADWIEQHFISNWEVGSSGEKALSANSLATFVKDYKAPLRQIFSENEVQRFQAIIDDIERAKRTLSMGKDPAGPSTAADTLAAARSGASLLSNVVTGGHHGWMLSLGRVVANAVKLSGTRSVDELVRKALLDPQLARQLLMPAAAKSNPSLMSAIARRLLIISWPAAGQVSEDKR